MKKDLTQKDFDALLDWLAADREEAGRQYEAIRDGLIKFFQFRGCHDAQELADITINRVASRISVLDESKNAATIAYFYGFALKVRLEYLREVKSRNIQLESDTFSPKRKTAIFPDEPKTEFDCLEICLMKLPPAERKLVLLYYSKDKSEKFELRNRLADAMKMHPNTLYSKIHRVKSILRKCVKKCLRENNS